MLGDGAGHEELAVGVVCLDFDFFGHVEPGLVGDDAGVEAVGFEFFGDVLRGFIVFGRGGDVGLGGEGLEFFAGELRVGNGEEGLVGLRLLGGEIAVAEDGGLAGASMRSLRDQECDGGDEQEGRRGRGRARASAKGSLERQGAGYRVQQKNSGQRIADSVQEKQGTEASG